MPRKIRCTVEAVIDHGGRVYTVDLVPAAPIPAFRAGQFLHLTVDDYDPAGFWPESRVFSIASSPHDRRHIRICYSVKARYTTRMEQKLHPGGEVWIKLPYGEFVIDGAQETVMLAGGTGISAFTAFIEALTPEQPKPVWLVYGARTPGLLLFQDMILSQLAAVPHFNVVFFAETPDESFAQQMAALPRAPRCLTGRISLDALLRPPSSVLCPPSSVLCPPSSALRPPSSALCPPSSALCPPSSVFYLSGPPVMLTSLSEQLKQRGVPPERIRTDAWE